MKKKKKKTPAEVWNSGRPWEADALVASTQSGVQSPGLLVHSEQMMIKGWNGYLSLSSKERNAQVLVLAPQTFTFYLSELTGWELCVPLNTQKRGFSRTSAVVWGCRSVVGHLQNVCGILDSISHYKIITQRQDQYPHPRVPLPEKQNINKSMKLWEN